MKYDELVENLVDKVGKPDKYPMWQTVSEVVVVFMDNNNRKHEGADDGGLASYLFGVFFEEVIHGLSC